LSSWLGMIDPAANIPAANGDCSIEWSNVHQHRSVSKIVHIISLHLLYITSACCKS